MPLGDGQIPVGRLDWTLRLYQHRGATKASAVRNFDGVPHVCYEQPEWDRVKGVADWLELVIDSRDTVHRTDTRTALRHGFEVELPRGPGWAVPLQHYSTHTQE